MQKLLDIYLIKEVTEPCAHCHKSAPEKGKTICSKCSQELKAFRNKSSKNLDDEGNKG